MLSSGMITPPFLFFLETSLTLKIRTFSLNLTLYYQTRCTPTKRQVSKRQISKRRVSKRPVSKRQVYKTSGLQKVWFQNVQFQTSGFKTSIEMKASKRPFFKFVILIKQKVPGIGIAKFAFLFKVKSVSAPLRLKERSSTC